MRWNERPRRALVLLKPDNELLPLAAQTIDYLLRDMGLKVMVEAAAAKIVGQVCGNIFVLFLFWGILNCFWYAFGYVLRCAAQRVLSFIYTI